MKILQKYILKELWLPFLLSFAILNFIFLAGYLVRAANFIIGRGVPLWETLYILILAMPEMISYTAPMSVLTAVLIVFGNLSQHNEIRAVKASGIHPLLVMAPALFIGLAMTFLMFMFNDQIMTNGGFELRRMTKKLLIEHPSALIEPGRFVKLTDTITILAKEVNGNVMRDIVAYENEGTDKPIRTIMAERGEIKVGANKSQMQIMLYDGSISDAEKSSVQSMQFKTYEFPSLGQDDLQSLQKKTREKTLAELLIQSSDPELSKENKREVWSAFHQRIAFSFGSFIFVFLGIPVAVLVHRGEIALSFGLSLAAASFYYILFVGAKTITLQGLVPPIVAFWAPNVLLMFFGGRLLKKSFNA